MLPRDVPARHIHGAQATAGYAPATRISSHATFDAALLEFAGSCAWILRAAPPEWGADDTQAESRRGLVSQQLRRHHGRALGLIATTPGCFYSILKNRPVARKAPRSSTTVLPVLVLDGGVAEELCPKHYFGAAADHRRST